MSEEIDTALYGIMDELTELRKLLQVMFGVILVILRENGIKIPKVAIDALEIATKGEIKKEESKNESP